MSRIKNLSDIFKGFSKLNLNQRIQKIFEAGSINEEDLKFLKSGGLKDTQLGEKFIENTIGYFQMPMGVATQFCIDGKELFIPMAVEETSIIAAASKTAKWIKETGTITTEVMGTDIIGQIQIGKVRHLSNLKNVIHKNKNFLINLANTEVVPNLVQRGGGVRDIQLRELKRDDGQDMAVIHILMNPCDAMGANLINQVCEFLKSPIQELSNETVTMCILSNLADSKITRAVVEMLVDEELGIKIQEASLFAELDSYRAATNNKGVLNGIDPILIATGNDWRAVEAGIHAYAARSGHYTSITKWRFDKDTGILKGVFEAPLIVGTVGGVTNLHPMAKMSLRMLGVQSSNDLSRIAAAVGLVQNLGALRALTTVGIIEGHMKLHIKNLSLGVGATETEIPLLETKLEEILTLTKRITLSHAMEVLKEIRTSQRM
ncbi:MAG: hydroxymethylglutaryl-CoA reductase, degradative [Deltaproteobacteria bacterium]|jgi:hydroxymethylglutaryl-CoA reductase|nr:hydroxymethylglutaryl-CoA reductase, degradative [Deltaproteobacteria bacterium]